VSHSFAELPYTSNVRLFVEDLAGLKVSHDLSKLEDGESHILTLKDSRILDNEGEMPHSSYVCLAHYPSLSRR
jgi:hypothetical protein